MILVSSCLTGLNCRYNGTSTYNREFLNTIDANYLHLCPELLGGFTIPRTPCEICNGNGVDVLENKATICDQEGNNITQKMLKGAYIALKICLDNKVTTAYLQANSPTCGYGQIYDGTFSHTLKTGNGIFAELLLKNGIQVIKVPTFLQE